MRLTVLLLIAVVAPVSSQTFLDLVHHPELEWRTIETAHFLVHYHNGAERTGAVVAKVAEEIYGPVTSLYNHEPDQKVSIIIRDVDDVANGAAYFYENRIEILAPSMDFIFRGTHNWLRNVVTHEFTHIVQIQTSMKFGRTIPGIYLQWLGYESEQRPDVLYGFPNTIVSYPISGFTVPVWFAEGVAQYNRKELRYDFWDSHRDMILRSYVLDSNMLTWEEMAVFGKTSLGNESAYNAGFAFVQYIAATYGEEKLADISRNLARIPGLTIDGAIKRSVGKDGRQVYEEWREELLRDYTARVGPIRANLREGKVIPFVDEPETAGEFFLFTGRPTGHGGAPHLRPAMPACCRAAVEMGFANLYPKFSPDGRKMAFTSTRGSDYLGGSSLHVADLETRKAARIQDGVGTEVSWSADGGKLYYSRLTSRNPHWSMQYDVYEYDLDAEKETRRTYGRRALSPAVSPDGSTLVFTVNNDGTTNLALASIDGSDVRVITSYANGEQVYSPEWSPSGDRILFEYSIRDGRDIAWVRPDGSDLTFLISGSDDSRDATFTPDGARVLFSSDRTGIFNVYSYDLGTGEIAKLTNVIGGAFMPHMDGQGNLVYAGYTSVGYKLHLLEAPVPLHEGDHQYLPTGHTSGLGPMLALRGVALESGQFNWTELRSYDDSRLPAYTPTPYRSRFTSLMVAPFVRFDNYNKRNTFGESIKAGVYLFSNDVLDKLGLFASAALNSTFERDLFLQVAYRDRLPGFHQLGLEPSLAVELYNVTRKSHALLSLPDRDPFRVDVGYNLLEFDLVLTQPVFSPSTHLEFRFAHSRYTSILENFTLFYPDRLPLFVQSSSDLYLIANELSLTFRLAGILRSTTMEINPVGRKVTVRVARELNKFNGDGEYEVTSTGLTPVYKKINFTRVELRWREHLPLPFNRHTLTASVRAASILGPGVDEFFDSYAGGLVGMKGYPFYSLGGNELAIGSLAYRFPLIEEINLQVLHLYFKRLYLSVYGDIGNAWTGRVPSLRDFKKDAGVELRLESFSFYTYPTRVFFNASYGFDEFDRSVRRGAETVRYGKEWRFYFGVLFGFEVD